MEKGQLILTQHALAESRHSPGRLSLNWRLGVDRVSGWSMGLITVGVSSLVLTITGALLARAWPLLSTHSLDDLLFSGAWQPIRGLFGFWPFLVGSAAVTLLAMLLAAPVALLSAVYLAEYTATRKLFKPVVDVLASIPSVVYGLWGMLVIVPLVRTTIGPWLGGTLGHVIPLFANNNPTGYGLLAGGIVLAIMVFPFVVAVAEEVLHSVPQATREASLALGATKWETVKYVVLRRARTGLIAAVVLGFSRAFGETLAVMMVIGNIAQVPGSVFDAAYPLPALIANNYGEMMSVPLYDAALMLAALILLLVVLVFNVGARVIIVRLEGGVKE